MRRKGLRYSFVTRCNPKQVIQRHPSGIESLGVRIS